jgi:hypothetical protein
LLEACYYCLLQKTLDWSIDYSLVVERSVADSQIDWVVRIDLIAAVHTV